MVSVPPEVSWCDFVGNYEGLGAIAGTHVRLGKELHWFRCRQQCPGAIYWGFALVLKPSQVSMFVWARNCSGIAMVSVPPTVYTKSITVLIVVVQAFNLRNSFSIQ